MLKVKLCCCGCSLRTSSVIIFWFFIISSVYNVFTTMSIMLTTKSKISEITELYIVCYTIINITVSIIGIKGVNSNKRKMLIPFIVYGTLHLIGLSVFMLYLFLSPAIITSHLIEILTVHGFSEETTRNIYVNDPILIIGIFFVFVLIIYLTLVVYSYYFQMNQPAEQLYSNFISEDHVDADHDGSESSTLS